MYVLLFAFVCSTRLADPSSSRARIQSKKYIQQAFEIPIWENVPYYDLGFAALTRGYILFVSGEAP